jgi:hypothetical protein
MAPADVRINLPDDDARDRELLLILRRDRRFHDRTRARRTLRGERHVVPFIDVRRHPPMAFPAVRASGLPARLFRMLLQRFGEGCRLSESGASRVVQLAFEMLDLLSKPLVFAAQSLALALRVLGALLPVGVIRSTIRVVRLGLPARRSYARIHRAVQDPLN